MRTVSQNTEQTTSKLPVWREPGNGKPWAPKAEPVAPAAPSSAFTHSLVAGAEQAPPRDESTSDDPVVYFAEQQVGNGWPHAASETPVRLLPIHASRLLQTAFECDAHLVQYTLPAWPAISGGSPMRLALAKFKTEHFAQTGPISMRVIGFDVDGPDHASGLPYGDDWFAGELPKINALRQHHPQLVVYATRSGYRIVGKLPPGHVLSSPEDVESWKGFYVACLAYLDRYFQIKADQTKDASRLLRLPYVVRDREAKQPRFVDGDISLSRAWNVPQHLLDLAKAGAAPAVPRGEADEQSEAPASVEHVARARAYVGKMPASIQGQNGSQAAFKAALMCHGFDLNASQIFEVLSSDFNPRCVPPWSDAELEHKAEDAARSSKPKGFMVNTSGPATKKRIVVSTDEHALANEVIDQLRMNSDLYTFNLRLGEVIASSSKDTDRDHYTGPVVREVPDAHLRDQISRLCSFVRVKKSKTEGEETEETETPAHVPDWLVRAISQRGAWGIRPFVGLLEAPSIDAHGRIIQDPGYDAATGYVLIPSEEFPRVPDAPTQADAARALAELAEVFCDFPFVSAADAMTPIAAILALIGRPAIGGAVPAFLVDASTAGSGKGLCTNVVSTVARGREASPVTFPKNEEELEKILSSYALRGAAIIDFDNLTGPFCGAPLDKVLTASDTVDLRVLGRNDQRTMKWRAIVFATGNNIQTEGDTTRRCLRARLEPIEDRPESRTGFKHSPLLPWVRQNRARLVVAALTVLRAHALAGRPNDVGGWGSFEEFAKVVLGAITWAGGANPTETRAELLETADHDAERVRALVNGWRRHDPGQVGLTVRQLVEKSGGDFELRAALAELNKDFDPEKIAKALHKFKGRRVDGFRLEHLPKNQFGRPWVARQ
ncbi:MAG: hypothetical protein ABI627_22985 [Polyangiaceae bacterium]